MVLEHNLCISLPMADFSGSVGLYRTLDYFCPKAGCGEKFKYYESRGYNHEEEISDDSKYLRM